MDDATYFRACARAFGGDWPEDYLVFDLETTGLSPDSDLIVEVGWAEVAARKVVDCGSTLLDWARHPAIDPYQLEDDLERVADRMRERGSAYHVTARRLREEGACPLEALDGFAELLDTVVADGMWVVGHNAAAFDAKFVESAVRRFCGKPSWRFPRGRLIDTGMVEKGRLAGEPPPMIGGVPAWYERVGGLRKKVSWSLAVACNERYGLNLSAEAAHAADADARATASLLEAMRSRSYTDEAPRRAMTCC